MKRGSTMLIKEIMGVVLSVLVIILVFKAASYAFSVFYGEQGEMHAKGTLEKINFLIKSIPLGETKSEMLFSPEGWWIIGFSKEKASPSECYQQNCFCICKNKKKFIAFGDEEACEKEAYCKIIEKPFKMDGKDAKMQIRIIGIEIKNSQEAYLLNIYETEFKPSKLDKSKFDKCEKNMQEYEEKIKEASSKNPVPEALIKAIMCQESDGISRTISDCGAAGLMQLMPGTAKERGIFLIFENINLTACNNEYAQRLKAAIAGKSDEEIIKIDERFDAYKNIIASIEYIVALQKKFSKEEKVLAAYNWGASNVEKCPLLKECKLPDETAKYIPSVLSLEKAFA